MCARQDFARVCKAVARGDLTQRVEVIVQSPDLQDLKADINGMVGNLSVFAFELSKLSREVGIEGS
jgi:osomolarity two-component system sensor histidine kinase NIK1